MRYCLIILIASLQFGTPLHAQEHTANKHMNQSSFEELVKSFERLDRASWQKPDEVLTLLTGIKGKKVMEIGAGTGYFSFRLQQAGAQVIAADIDERFIAYIDSVKQARELTDKQINSRLVPPNDPKLSKREVDMVMLVNTFHHIEDRVNYFRKVKTGLKSQGFVVIVDYFKKDIPMGPPLAMKLSADDVIRDLKMAGFSTFKTDDTTLPFQYIVFAL